MKRLIFIVILGSLMAKCYTAPVNSQTADDFEEDPELIGGFFQGDMNITMTRNGLSLERNLWPNGIVPFKIDKGFDYIHEIFIRIAMINIETYSCIRFIPAKDDVKAYIHFKVSPLGCNAEIGYTGDPNIISLENHAVNTGCFRMGSIQHEILHTLGFFHQHSVPNRDEYIKIVKENIRKDALGQFKKFSNKIITDFGVGYDYDSVMHYDAYAFTKNGKKTIIPLKGENIEIGQRRTLSAGDWKKLNLMYKCPPKPIPIPKST